MALDAFRDFRASHPACAQLTLSDARSGTVLAAEGALAYPQEYLDAISSAARDALNLAGPSGSHALFHSPHGARLFFRVPQMGDAALTCLAHPDADLEDLILALSDLAATLVAEDVDA